MKNNHSALLTPEQQKEFTTEGYGVCEKHKRTLFLYSNKDGHGVCLSCLKLDPVEAMKQKKSWSKTKEFQEDEDERSEREFFVEENEEW